MNRKESTTSDSPKRAAWVVGQEEPVNEIHIVRELVLSLQKTVQGVDEKCDRLGERFGEFTAYMIRAKTQEEERQLPTKIEAMSARILALEQANKDALSVKTGRRSVWDYTVAIIALLALLIGAVDSIKGLFGK